MRRKVISGATRPGTARPGVASPTEIGGPESRGQVTFTADAVPAAAAGPMPPELRRGRSAGEVPLAMDPEEFRRLGHAMVDRIAEHLEALPGKPVAPGESPEVVRVVLGADRPLPSEGAEPGLLLEEATDLLMGHSLFNGHPRFFGYITAAPAPVGMLADLLASAVNPNVGGWSLSPVASEMEVQTVRWIAELMGYPADCGGLLVSGGNAANFVGFLAARASAGARWRIRRTGLHGPGSTPLRVYCSTETHTWIEKAADLFGLGTEAVRLIGTDEGLRMDPEALRGAIRADREAGLLPFLVVGTAGSTSTGAVDPLPELARVCREEEIWFHVDGAYGGFAARVPGAPQDLAALAEADSVAVDPHKWLYAPLEAGCALVRRPEALREAFSYRPPYYHFGFEATNFVDYGLQNSRGFRALKVWLGLRQAGREGYLRMIAQDMALARHLHGLTRKHPELEAVTHGLSVTVFRYIPPELRARIGHPEVDRYLNDLNEEVQDRLERSGKAFVSNAVVDGRYCLRACIVNFNTTVADVEALPELVAEVGREAHASATRFREREDVA
jgi:aromatic-L-amino-acid/L-tryptophan decarboxylase